MKKYTKDGIAHIILTTLLGVGLITVMLAAPNTIQLFRYFKPKNAYEREKVRKSLRRLKKRGFIKSKDDLDGYFVLTAKGKARAMRYQIEHTRIECQKVWDRKWRLIMFDVPEERKKARQAINFALKKIGCTHYQKSVFLTPFPCQKEIDFVGETFGVRDCIKIVVAESIEGSLVFEKKFKL